MNIYDSKFMKWIPVVIAGIVAMAQTIGEQKQQERIDDMDERIKSLESRDESQ